MFIKSVIADDFGDVEITIKAGGIIGWGSEEDNLKATIEKYGYLLGMVGEDVEIVLENKNEDDEE